MFQDDTYFWLLILGMGLITFALRLSILMLWGRVEIPTWLQQALRFVPPSVLTAIIFPELFRSGSGAPFQFLNPRLLAGLVAAAVAFRTRNVLVTVGAGMAVLWALQSLAR